MYKRHILVLAFITILLLMTSCQSAEDITPTATAYSTYPVTEPVEQESFLGQPNPASFYCEEMGYRLEMREEEGGTVGICILPKGKECEEWDFLAGRCGQEYSFCEQQGYTLQEGDETAKCVFPDGSTCPEYDLFIGECSPPEDE